MKSKGLATRTGSRGCGVNQVPHQTPSQSEKPPRVFPKFAQKISLSHVSPILEHFLQSPAQFHHRRDVSKFPRSVVTKWEGKLKKRDSQQELGHNSEFDSIISQKSISLLNRLLHSSKYSKQGQTKTWATSNGLFNFACTNSSNAIRAPVGEGAHTWMPGWCPT